MQFCPDKKVSEMTGNVQLLDIISSTVVIKYSPVQPLLICMHQGLQSHVDGNVVVLPHLLSNRHLVGLWEQLYRPVDSVYHAK